MKTLIGISLFIFWSVITALLVAGLVFYQNNNINTAVSPPLDNQPSNSASIVGNVPAGIVFNSQEISKHNTLKDCWLIINNKVYNVTSYIPSHPGGASAIISYCGKEATAAFDTKGGTGNSHSSNAVSLLVNYYIGDFNQTINRQTVQQNVQQTNSVPPPPGRGGEEDDD